MKVLINALAILLAAITLSGCGQIVNYADGQHRQQDIFESLSGVEYKRLSTGFPIFRGFLTDCYNLNPNLGGDDPLDEPGTRVIASFVSIPLDLPIDTVFAVPQLIGWTIKKLGRADRQNFIKPHP